MKEREEVNGQGGKKVRMALAGLGSMGKQYAKMIDGGEIPGMELSAVCVRRKESGDWGEDNLKHKVPVYIGMDELFGHAEEFDEMCIRDRYIDA